MKENFFKDAYCEMWIENGIIYVIYVRGVQLSIEITKSIVAKRIEICNGKTYPLYTDLNQSKIIDKASRKYLATEGCKYLSAVAILTNSYWDVVACGIFMSVSGFPLPIKMFTEIKSALNWVSHYKDTEYPKNIMPISLSS